MTRSENSSNKVGNLLPLLIAGHRQKDDFFLPVLFVAYMHQVIVDVVVHKPHSCTQYLFSVCHFFASYQVVDGLASGIAQAKRIYRHAGKHDGQSRIVVTQVRVEFSRNHHKERMELLMSISKSQLCVQIDYEIFNALPCHGRGLLLQLSQQPDHIDQIELLALKEKVRITHNGTLVPLLKLLKVNHNLVPIGLVVVYSKRSLMARIHQVELLRPGQIEFVLIDRVCPSYVEHLVCVQFRNHDLDWEEKIIVQINTSGLTTHGQSVLNSGKVQQWIPCAVHPGLEHRYDVELFPKMKVIVIQFHKVHDTVQGVVNAEKRINVFSCFSVIRNIKINDKNRII